MKLLNALLLISLLLLLQVAVASGTQKADGVLVIKQSGRLYLLKDGARFASFKVTFGGNPVGHKQSQGDQRTPEGHYMLDYKNSNSKYYKSIHISYPNAQDKANARRRNVDPGGDIMIHGQTNGWEWASGFMQFVDWTNGCIALSNRDMDKVWEAVDPGTPIEIRP
jgi:murein L,D-transpeptidase YafK